MTVVLLVIVECYSIRCSVKDYSTVTLMAAWHGMRIVVIDRHGSRDDENDDDDDSEGILRYVPLSNHEANWGVILISLGVHDENVASR